ncbi:hypothetical protein BH10ACT8_BH10ACT8_14680 [soil metagenome]
MSTSSSSEPTTGLQHVVLFAFPEDLNDTDAAEMRRQITSWPELIGGFRSLRFGSDLTGARTRGHQYLLYMEFDSAVELVAYQQHPVHQVFLAWIIEHNCTPLAFDYELTSGTVIWPHPAPVRPGKS